MLATQWPKKNVRWDDFILDVCARSRDELGSKVDAVSPMQFYGSVYSRKHTRFRNLRILF